MVELLGVPRRVLVPVVVIVFRIIIPFLAFHFPGPTAKEAEEFEVVDLVSETKHKVLARGFVDLHAGGAKREHTSVSVLQLAGEVVVECDIDADKWRELLVDADGGDVEHAVGRRQTRGCVGDEAKPVHILQPCAETGIRTDGEDALVAMVDVDALEKVPEGSQFAQSAVSDGPVGQHPGQRGEEVERLPTNVGVGGNECRNEDIGTI